MNAANLTENEYLYGHKACPGCALGIVGRLGTKVFGEKTVIALPASCMSSVTTVYPNMSYTVPSMTSPFAATGAVLNGLAAGFHARGIENVRVVGFAGDGGTADIGLQAISGAIDQGRNFIYVCYDNEAYMNTGIQRSGLTPYGATTTTTPAGVCSFGEKTGKKNMFEIVMAHRIPYAATASVAYPNDLVRKFEKARDTDGPAFLHVMAPCPTGWGFAGSDTIKIAQMAVECGLWYLAEYENGEAHLNVAPKELESVGSYLKAQRRFRHLSEDHIKQIEEQRNKDWEKLVHWKDDKTRMRGN